MTPFSVSHHASRVKFTNDDIDVFCKFPLQQLSSFVHRETKGVEGIGLMLAHLIPRAVPEPPLQELPVPQPISAD